MTVRQVISARWRPMARAAVAKSELPLMISRKRRLRGIACPQSAADLRAARRKGRMS